MSDTVFTDSNFKDQVLDEKSMPVLVDFWAPWCGPCKIVGPVVEKLAEEFKGKIKVGKMNVDDEVQTAGTYGIMSIPTLMFFKNGQPVKSIIGAQGEDALRKAINEVLAL